jgi:GNAT superfamily N-acetyltransferase
MHVFERLSGFIAEQRDTPVGLITYQIEGEACEIVSLDSLVEGQGVGSSLVAAVRGVAMEQGCARLWLVTTNDNTPALRFYQKQGFRLVMLHKYAIETARQLKPEIPTHGFDGIPIRDEIELEVRLDT